MKSDRELLELAAKAAGYVVEPDAHIPSGGIWLAESDGDKPWNPLTDDGDALRLAVELRLDIRFLDGFKQVSCFRGAFGDAMHLHGLVGYGGGADREPSAENVRRAIVRVAAAIGEAMQ